ncbi:uncharacterized protein LOC106165442 [Lingula anatina]|uniref:Uncharacterized protein LOC106165442 n=1 Tax=Lingula anatina TaxID=7574 RepID=A0A1S3ILI6_LINAN|nr:uncharacterized protein LOC106165442 [Lingula anatina]|eukprot:XP_013399105.1 uncharacterized protein LOC106165442 [Lingula anatina]
MMTMNKWTYAVPAVIIIVFCISMIIYHPVCEVKVDQLSNLWSNSKKEVPHKNFMTTEFIKRLGTGNIDPVNEDLLEYLRGKWVLPPSSLSYNLTNPKATYWNQLGQSKVVDNILKQRRKGFFVECGALNGEAHSNSLFFEKLRDWEGLLVEPNPWAFEALLSKNRKSYTINTCLSTGSSPVMVDFQFAWGIGGIQEYSHTIPKAERGIIQGKSRIQCFPIRSILAAIGRTHVDYFTLDVEGAEIEIPQRVSMGPRHRGCVDNRICSSRRRSWHTNTSERNQRDFQKDRTVQGRNHYRGARCSFCQKRRTTVKKQT